MSRREVSARPNAGTSDHCLDDMIFAAIDHDSLTGLLRREGSAEEIPRRYGPEAVFYALGSGVSSGRSERNRIDLMPERKTWKPGEAARVLIVVAGMEGALPSVVGGLTAAPVIAVPTSVGYGASFGGITALLAMLNSCASGVSVVNIDNGFGAAAIASSINHLE